MSENLLTSNPHWNIFCGLRPVYTSAGPFDRPHVPGIINSPAAEEAGPVFADGPSLPNLHSMVTPMLALTTW